LEHSVVAFVLPDSPLFDALAAAYQAGEPEAEQVVERGGVTPGRRWRWLRPLADRYVQAKAGGARPRHRDVVQFLREDRGFHRTCAKYFDELPVPHRLVAPQRMLPVAAGPASQNREAHHDFRAHPEGRVGYVETINPAKATRLRAILERIVWP
jgi:hypothetical protein